MKRVRQGSYSVLILVPVMFVVFGALVYFMVPLALNGDIIFGFLSLLFVYAMILWLCQYIQTLRWFLKKRRAFRFGVRFEGQVIGIDRMRKSANFHSYIDAQYRNEEGRQIPVRSAEVHFPLRYMNALHDHSRFQPEMLKVQVVVSTKNPEDYFVEVYLDPNKF